jgi:glyoxylase-like metal-dependent hydrolase (beta-lactamase superfamily II)
MKKKSFLVFFVGTCSLLLFSCGNKNDDIKMPDYNDALLQKIRVAASAIPGDLPIAINYTKYASSVRKWKDMIEGGGEDPATMARTAFQVEYSQGWIMIDAGMDRAVHHFFEKERPQPFDDSAAGRVATALQQAKLIVVTHEHGDHVAGVVRNANNMIPPKTILTKEQVNSLINNPQMPEIKLDENKSKDYIVVDFESVLPVAPGIVLIKAPGHTAGEIMVYTKLQNGKEYIFTGDVTWAFRGVQEKKSKPKSERNRIGENGDHVEKQLAWLNDRLVKDKMVILVSHDDIVIPQYAAQGLIGNTIKTSQ